jgi:hypothetical protein
MDDVTVNYINSQGDTYIKQMCNQCDSGGNCSCFIDKNSYNFITSHANIVLEQDCGQCYTFDPENPFNFDALVTAGASSVPTWATEWERKINEIVQTALENLGQPVE